MTDYSFLAGRKLTSDWATHRARGSLGGHDFAAPVGTDIKAPGDGVVDYRTAGTGGWTVRIRYANGWAHEIMHNSVQQFLPNGTHVKAGQHIGESGGAVGSNGAGESTGPHIHIHGTDYRGGRVPYDTVIVPAPVVVAPASGVVPAGETDKDFVRRVSRYLNRRTLKVDTTAEFDGIRGKAYWTEIQTAGRQDGLYGTAYKIDGIPGAKTYELEKHYGRIA